MSQDDTITFVLQSAEAFRASAMANLRVNLETSRTMVMGFVGMFTASIIATGSIVPLENLLCDYLGKVTHRVSEATNNIELYDAIAFAWVRGRAIVESPGQCIIHIEREIAADEKTNPAPIEKRLSDMADELEREFMREFLTEYAKWARNG